MGGAPERIPGAQAARGRDVRYLIRQAHVAAGASTCPSRLLHLCTSLLLGRGGLQVSGPTRDARGVLQIRTLARLVL